LALRYLNHPESEDGPFIVSVRVAQHKTVSEQSLQKLRPDYQEYYKRFFEKVR
jgi:hypothetical protein